MPTQSLFVPMLLISGSLAMPLQAGVTVTNEDPDRFTDAGDRNSDPVKVMKEIALHLKHLGDKYLPPSVDLRIEVLDLDRAGRPNPPTDIRVMKGGADIPCLEVRYALAVDGKVAPSRRERVCDFDYLRRVRLRANENDPLAFEKRMIDEWFQERFAKGR
jgi:hypothetical protein